MPIELMPQPPERHSKLVAIGFFIMLIGYMVYVGVQVCGKLSS